MMCWSGSPKCAEGVHALGDGLFAEQLLAELEALFGLVFGVHANAPEWPRSWPTKQVSSPGDGPAVAAH